MSILTCQLDGEVFTAIDRDDRIFSGAVFIGENQAGEYGGE